MERLEPILKQKFWILLGIGLLMTVVGWWMATGSLAAQIAARKGEIEGAFSKVPSGSIPNDSWSTQLAAVNAEQERAVKFTARGLWERQKERMRWPDTVAEFAWESGYRGEIALAGRENYRTAYGYDVRRVWGSVRPFDPLSGDGIVEFGSQQAEALPQQVWGTLAPSSAEMWDAQEDLWLLESILQSIVDVNGGVNGERLDASIHQIEKLELHGGVPAAQRKVGGAAGPAGPGGANGPPGMSPGGGPASGPGGGSLGGLGATGPGGRGGIAIGVADFDWKEEFGDDGTGTGRGLGGPGGGPGGSSSTGPMAAHGPAGGPGGPGAAAAPKIRRYIEDDAALPYKTRGFYLTVLMDHRKIPALISELTSSEKSAWPVEIVRVQMARLHDDDVDSTGGPGFPGGSGRGGSPFAAGVRRPSASSGFGGEGFAPIGPTGFGPGGGQGTPSPQAEAANIALSTALQDPFMARVALCGIITLYKEVKADPSAVVPGATQPGTNDPTKPAGSAPTAGPGDASADGAAAVPAGGTPETPAESTPTETPEKPDPNPERPGPTPPAPADGKGPDPKPAADPNAAPKDIK